MKLSESWLREWVNPAATAAELAHKLNLAGLECEAEPLLAELPQGVVVGRIETAEQHPQADRLRVCRVDVGDGELKQIVCGAANARVGLCAPVALPGARLPGGMEIKAAKLRGVESFGMLCSAKELGLAVQSDGLLELDADAVPGTPIETHLTLADGVLELELTPNRGDCLSVQGLARETGALYGLPVQAPQADAVAITSARALAVTIESEADCTAYAGRVVEGLAPDARSPDWLREKLRRSGLRNIHPVVDVTNYVMLELGQPLHAFDLVKLDGDIVVRRARAGDALTMLTGDDAKLTNELLITDARGAVAMAGVMGGQDSGVTAGTTAIFLESAAFTPAAVAGVARRHKLSSDAAYRYERGVDPALHLAALERATALVLAICGGSAGPVTLAGGTPERAAIALSRRRLVRLLGQDYAADTIERTLRALGVACEATGQGDGGEEWRCTPPSWRFDLAIEEDLIEEVARVVGYDNIPVRPYAAALASAPQSEARRSAARIKDALAARGWQEVVTYSFVEPKLQARLAPARAGIPLDNPIAETMGVMRTTLFTGLVGAWRHNQARQQARVKIFELAATFGTDGDAVVQTTRLAGLLWGDAQAEQWGAPALAADFFDLKGEVEALTALFGGEPVRYAFRRGEHAALHPGRTAEVLRDGAVVGVLGELHPELVAELGAGAAPLLFELDWDALGTASLPRTAGLSDFPTARRDLALVVPEAIESGALLAAIRSHAGPQLVEAKLFDVYRGKGLEEASKSLAFGLIFQDISRTLQVEEVDAAVARVTGALQQEFGATQRL